MDDRQEFEAMLDELRDEALRREADDDAMSELGSLKLAAPSQDWFQDIIDFHEKFRPRHAASLPSEPPAGLNYLTQRLVEEEVEELYAAVVASDIARVADSCADAIVVILGLALAWGIDMRPIWAEVHAANMRKEGGDIREDGKILKPPGWTPPDIDGVLDRQIPMMSRRSEPEV